MYPNPNQGRPAPPPNAPLHIAPTSVHIAPSGRSRGDAYPDERPSFAGLGAGGPPGLGAGGPQPQNGAYPGRPSLGLFAAGGTRPQSAAYPGRPSFGIGSGVGGDRTPSFGLGSGMGLGAGAGWVGAGGNVGNSSSNPGSSAAYPDERPSMGMGLEGSSSPGNSTDKKQNNIVANWMDVQHVVQETGGPPRAPTTAWGAFTAFKKGGVLDPNKAAEDAIKRQKKGPAEEDLPIPVPKPKRVITADDFKNKRVSKGVKKVQAKGGTASILSKLKRKREKEDKEASDRAKKVAMTPFVLKADATLEQRVQDVLTYSFNTGVKPLYVASESGQSDCTEYFLNEGADVDTTNGMDWSTPLHGACSNGHYQVASLLLDASADVDAMTSSGATALHVACQKGHFELARALLREKANADAETECGITPLMFAARFGQLDVVKLLVDCGADLFAVVEGLTAHDWALEDEQNEVADFLQVQMRVRKVYDQAEATGLSALFIAAEGGHTDLAQDMLGSSGDPDIRERGKTPLYVACEHGHGEFVDLLLSRRADPNVNVEGKTPVMAAAEACAFPAIKSLVAAGADLDATHDGKNAFAFATQAYADAKAAFAIDLATAVSSETEQPPEPPPPIARQYLALMERRHQLEPDFIDKVALTISQGYEHGIAPLSVATEKGEEDVVMCMIDDGADVDGMDMDGSTALLVACSMGLISTVHLLLDKGALCDAANFAGATPIHMACQRNFAQITRLLLDYGANPNVTFQGGITPMMMAVRYGAVEAAEELRSSNVDLSLKFEAKTALDYALEEDSLPEIATVLRHAAMEQACEKGPVEDVRYLLFQGCDPCEAVNSNGVAPLHISSTYGQTDIVKLLLEHKAPTAALQQSGASALHFACQKGHHEIVQCLLGAKADPNLNTFRNGVTPLMMAARFGQLSIAKLLCENGADSQQQFEGKRAVDWAEAQEQFAVMRYLVQFGKI